MAKVWTGIRKMTTEKKTEILDEWRWLLGRMKPIRGKLAVVTALGMAAAAMSVLSSVASRNLIDALVSRNAKALWVALFFLGSLTLGGTGLKLFSSRLNAKLQIRVQNGLRMELFGKMLRASWQELDQHSSGDLLSRLNSDMGVVANGTMGLVPGLLVAGIRLLGAMVILLYFDPVTALIAALGTPVTLLASHLLLKKMRKHDLMMKDLGMEMMSFQEDSLRNLTQIKAMGASDVYKNKMSDLHGAYAQGFLTYHGFRIRMSACLSALNLPVTGLCLCWGAYLLWVDGISYGALVMLLQLVGMLRGALSALGGQMQQAVTVLTSAGRIMAVERLPEENAEVPPDFSPDAAWEIRLDQVTCRYRTGEAVLENFDFAAKPGELVAVTGPSGVGKTTLLRLLLGLLSPTAGTARLIGPEGQEFPISPGTRGAFAYVPQGNSILAGSIGENLRIAAPEASDEALWAALETACAKEFVEQLPGGLNHPLHGGGKGLSEGQCQRLAIARGILRGAPILLLDESTSALDAQTEEKLLENLRHCDAVGTCVLVTHRDAAARRCCRRYEIRG